MNGKSKEVDHRDNPNPILPPQFEARERFLAEHGMWGAGLLSIGGSLDIEPIIEDTLSTAVAHVSFPDNDYRKVRRLLELMGGKIYSHSKGSEYSWTWRLETPDNPWSLITAVLSYMPTHNNYLGFGNTWNQMTDLERYKAARRAQIKATTQRITILDYQNLVTMPQIAASVIDGRGSLFAGYENEPNIPTMEVNSSNRPLMEALHGYYGGELAQRTPTRPGHELLAWRMNYSNAKSLYEIVRPHLLLRAERAAEVFEGRHPRHGP